MVGACGEDAGEVALGEGGSSGCYDVGEACFVGGDCVGVALDDPRCSARAYALGGFGYAVEGFRLVV